MPRAYGSRVTDSVSTTQDLLHDLKYDVVVPERYSRRSFASRSDGLVTTSVLATIAVVCGMVLGSVRSQTR